MTDYADGKAHAVPSEYDLLRASTDRLFTFDMTYEDLTAIASLVTLDVALATRIADEIWAWATEVKQDPERLAQEDAWIKGRNLQAGVK